MSQCKKLIPTLRIHETCACEGWCPRVFLSGRFQSVRHAEDEDSGATRREHWHQSQARQNQETNASGVFFKIKAARGTAGQNTKA